jgi:hypothetical protein
MWHSGQRSMPARPFKLTAPVVREHPQHKAIADVLRLELAPAGRLSPHGVVWWSIDMADFGGSVPGTRVARGVCAGVPDLFFLHLGRTFLAEIKALDGILSDAQRSVLSATIGAWGSVAVVRDATDMLACLDQWKIPRAMRIRGTI